MIVEGFHLLHKSKAIIEPDNFLNNLYLINLILILLYEIFFPGNLATTVLNERSKMSLSCDSLGHLKGESGANLNLSESQKIVVKLFFPPVYR